MLGIFGTKHDEPTFRIPDGEAYDLADLIGKNGHVVIETIEGTTLVLARAPHTELGAMNHLLGVTLAIMHPFREDAVVREDVACNRYITVWDNINPSRRGQRWEFWTRADNKPVLWGHCAYATSIT